MNCFGNLNWVVRCVASKLVTRDVDRELAGEEKCIVSNCGFAGSRFAARVSPQTRKGNLLQGYGISRRYDKLIKETLIEANKDASPITDSGKSSRHARVGVDME